MDYRIIKKIISYLLISSIFLTGESIADAAGLDVYWYYPLYIIFAAGGIIAYHRINKKILFALVGIIVYSLITYQYGLGLVFKQIINIVFILFVFYNFIIFEEYNYAEIFKKYVHFSKVVLILGFVQVLLFAAGFSELYLKVFPFLQKTAISTRFQSIAQEPSFIAFTFAPVVFLSFYNLFHQRAIFMSKVWSVLFIIGYTLTLSSVAYIGMVLMVLVLYGKNFTIHKAFTGIMIITGTLIMVLTAYWTVSEVKLRVDDTWFALVHGIDKNSNYRRVNLSTYALLSNVYVAEKSLQENAWVGNGLGTHELTYDRFMPEEMLQYMIINRTDACSMALRLLTETGLIGFAVFILFLFRYKVKSRLSFTMTEQLYWVINAGIFIMILLVLFRSGHYTIHGRILFLLLYYYSYQAVKNEKDTRHIGHLTA